MRRSFWFTLVLTHQMAVSLFRFIGALARSQVVASSVGCALCLALLSLQSCAPLTLNKSLCMYVSLDLDLLLVQCIANVF